MDLDFYNRKQEPRGTFNVWHGGQGVRIWESFMCCSRCSRRLSWDDLGSKNRQGEEGWLSSGHPRVSKQRWRGIWKCDRDDMGSKSRGWWRERGLGTHLKKMLQGADRPVPHTESVGLQRRCHLLFLPLQPQSQFSRFSVVRGKGPVFHSIFEESMFSDFHEYGKYCLSLFRKYFRVSHLEIITLSILQFAGWMVPNQGINRFSVCKGCPLLHRWCLLITYWVTMGYTSLL